MPLIILHGLYGSISNWRSVAKELSKDFSVYCLDLRNHGDSPWHQVMDYQSMARDVAHFIQARKMNKFALMGHSMGGKVAMSLAQLNLVDIQKMIVVDIAPVTYPADQRQSHEKYLGAMQQVAALKVSTRQEADLILQEYVPEIGLRLFLLQNLRKTDTGYEWRINIESIKDNISNIMAYSTWGQSDVPTLFLRGGHSEYVLDEYANDISQFFSNWSIQTIPEAGHWLHAEYPESFVDNVRAFLSP